MQLVTLEINSLKVYWESWSFSIWLGAFLSVPELNFTAGSQMRKPWSWCVDESLILSFAPPTEMKQHEVCLSLKFSSLTQTRWVCICVWSGWMCAFRSLAFCKIKILNIRTFTQVVAGEKITLQMRRWVKGFCSVFRYKVQSTLWSETHTFGTGSVSLTMVSVLWINKGSKEKERPTLGVRFTELSVLYRGVHWERVHCASKKDPSTFPF